MLELGLDVQPAFECARDSDYHRKWPSVKQAAAGLGPYGSTGVRSFEEPTPNSASLLKRPLINSSNICYYCVETVERLRGSPTLISWMDANKAENYSQYVAEINADRLGEPTEKTNMDVDRDTDVFQG